MALGKTCGIEAFVQRLSLRALAHRMYGEAFEGDDDCELSAVPIRSTLDAVQARPQYTRTCRLRATTSARIRRAISRKLFKRLGQHL